MLYGKELPLSFFDDYVFKVCPKILGKYLCIKKNNTIERYIITEVEAYNGTKDQACHARFGKTPRNAPMFGPPGHWYIYMIYGMYYMLNIVTGPGNYPSAILIRGVEGIAGPGKITKVLNIDKRFQGKPAIKKTGLWIENSPFCVKKTHILHSPRIGIEYASPTRRNKLWNFKILHKENITER